MNKTANDDFSNFLEDWEAFCTKFAHSTTYALVHSSAADLTSSPVTDNDGNDDDQTMIESGIDPTPTSHFDDSLCLLRRSVRALAAVNQQFTQFLDSLDEQVPCQTAIPLETIRQHPQLCPAPQLERTPSHILPKMPPDQAATIHKQPLPPPEPQTVMMDHDQLTRFSNKPPWPLKAKPKIPPWARPVAIAGDNHWPPPRLELKTTPYKKKAMTKCTIVPCIREKDSLRLP